MVKRVNLIAGNTRLVFTGFEFKRIVSTLTLVILLSIIVVPQSNSQTGYYTLNGGTASFSNQTYTATGIDQSAVFILNSGHLTLTSCTMSKTGDASNVNNSSQYGINAGVLSNTAGVIIIIGGTVTTNASGGNGLFATGSGSSITMSNGTINANGSNAHGVDVTYTGTIILNNVNVTSTGPSSSAIATDFGGGTVTVTGGTIIAADTAADSHSAGIYSTGVITVNSAIVKSLGDCGGVIDGANSIILNNTALYGLVEGIKTWHTAPASGTAYVTISGGSLTVTAGDGFYLTGGALTNFTISGGTVFSIASGKLINVTGSSTAILSLNGETVSGNLRSESTSTLNVSLLNGTALTGDARYAALAMDSTSVWNVTANSILTTISDASKISGLNVTNIIGNGHNVHYDSTLSGNSYLHALTYNLVNGGYLTPGAVTIGINEINSTVPSEYKLGQNYPNPFNPTTKINFSIMNSGLVTLKVYNNLGKEISTLVNQNLNNGTYTCEFNGNGLPSGVYFYRLKTGGYTETRKMFLIK